MQPLRLTATECREARGWLGFTQAELAAEMNLSVLAIKRYEKNGCGGASARLLQLLADRPAASRPRRAHRTDKRSSNRPAYRSIKPGDWRAVDRYEVVEPKLDGHYAELSGGPRGWVLTSRGGHTVNEGTDPLPRCRLLVEDLGFHTTQWARFEAPRALADKLVAWAAVDQRGRHLPRARLVKLVYAIRAAGIEGLTIVHSDQYPIESARDAWERFVECEGWEGLVFKTADGTRFAKMKPRVSWDYVCTEVDGGSAIGGVYTQRGALVKEATRCPVPDNVDLRPGMVFEVRGLKVSDRGTMRSPRFVRLRPDKPAEDCLTPIAVLKLSEQ